MTHAFEMRRLDAPFGVELVGASPRRLLREPAAAHWVAALGAHQLLVVRDAAISADEQVELMACLGEPLVENDSGRAHQFVSNVHEEGILGDERFAFHADHAFMPDPIDAISLHALEIPGAGSCTRFVSGLAAAAALPSALRDRIDGRRARHCIDPSAKSEDVAVRGPARSDDLPHADHPLLRPDPRSGAPVLFANEQQTDRVEGLDAAASRVLLEALFAHLYSGRFEYVHSWREGDLVIWNNMALQHARDAIPAGARRTLRRVAVGGTPVHEYFRRNPKWGLALEAPDAP